jgi:hypothetical protein
MRCLCYPFGDKMCVVIISLLMSPLLGYRPSLLWITHKENGPYVCMYTGVYVCCLKIMKTTCCRFVMFDNYHISKEAALDKLGGVDDQGNYTTPFRDPNKRFGASLGILSGKHH